jgi:hypothetical protein
MKIWACLLIIWNTSVLSQTVSSPQARSIYLNGVDISSARNQELSKVNIRIDSQGNLYIEAPHYDVQRETTFLPLGRQLPGQPKHLEHKPPTALNQNPNPAGQAKRNLASPPETSDTMKGPSPGDNSGAEAAPLPKEGTRTPIDGTENRGNVSPEIPTNPG